MKTTCAVVITSHDWKRTEWFLEAVESLYKQTVLADEIILISDHDRLPTMADKLNEGIANSKTDTIIPMGDDDLLDECYVEKTIDAMNFTGADIVFTDMQMFGQESAVVRYGRYDEITDRNTLPITSLFKKKVWEAHPYKPIDFLDWDFWWSAYENRFTAHHLEEPLFKYRTHPDQWSRHVDVEWAEGVVRGLHDK